MFLAVHRHLGHYRAIKVVPPDFSDARSDLAKRLLAEGRVMARLRHPAIVQVFECDTQAEEGPFLAMEYLQGEPAGEWLGRLGSLQRHPRVAAALVGTVADALAHAHQQGIIHRDLKPANLFIVPDAGDASRFSVKVLDFGLATIQREEPPVTVPAGSLSGTPGYLAPEEWETGAAVDERTDVYSLGCVLFELLSGRRPFAGEQPLQLMRAHLLEEPPDVRAFAPAVEGELAALVARMLEKAPCRRPQTMGAVAEAMESYLGIDRARFGDLLVVPEDDCGPGPRPARVERTVT